MGVKLEMVDKNKAKFCTSKNDESQVRQKRPIDQNVNNKLSNEI